MYIIKLYSCGCCHCCSGKCPTYLALPPERRPTGECAVNAASLAEARGVVGGWSGDWEIVEEASGNIIDQLSMFAQPAGE